MWLNFKLNIMKKILYFVAIGLFMLASCWDEDVHPSTEPELIYGKYSLPQGDHDYDDDIVEFHQNYSSLFLYKFTSKDLGWSPTNNAAYDETKDTVYDPWQNGSKWHAETADEMYVGEQLELLHDKCFNYFPDTFLYLLPQKILLCSVIETVPIALGYNPPAEERTPYNTYTGFQLIAVSRGNENIQTMTSEERNQFKIDVCSAFLSFIMGALETPTEFFLVSSYTSETTAADIYANGILNYDHRNSPNDDWFDYVVMIISNSLEELEAEGGLLSSSVDTQGKIREKYNIMVDFFKSRYNFDIQAIGNDKE